MINTLLRYKPLMDNVVETMQSDNFDKTFKGRYDTFKYCFEHVAKIDGRIRIIELGTSRSFLDGKFEGYNSDNKNYWNPENFEKWDFGAGCFTYMAAEYFTKNHPNFELHTVDLSSSHIERCKHMTLPFKNNISYYVNNSLHFLETFKTKCELIYMDTGDMTPIEPTAMLQLEEAKIIIKEQLLNNNGLILIDDVRNPAAFAQTNGNILGKAKYSIPYLKKYNFNIIMDEYQVVISK